MVLISKIKVLWFAELKRNVQTLNRADFPQNFGRSSSLVLPMHCISGNFLSVPLHE